MHRTARALVLLGLISVTGAIPIDNGVVGSAVECSADSIKVVFQTKNPFQGRIFVKGNVDKAECVHSYTDNPAEQSTNPDISFMFGNCNMQRERRLAPQKGMMQSIVVIISFHRIFLTKVDRAYKIQCFYMEADKVLTASLDVSMLTTSNLEDTAGMPMCKYTVRSGSRDGPETRYATIGAAIYHEWECESTTHGILIKNCVVDDGNNEKHDIIDSRGCAIDPVIMPDLTYDTTGQAKAFVESHAFKFADKQTVFFQCVVQLCNKGEPECDSLTPPQCTPGYTRSPVSNEAVGGQTISGEGEQTIAGEGASTIAGEVGSTIAGEVASTIAAEGASTIAAEGTQTNPAEVTGTVGLTSAPTRFGFRRRNFQYRAKRNASVLTSRGAPEPSTDLTDDEMDLTSNAFVVLDLEDVSSADIQPSSERSHIVVSPDILPELSGGGGGGADTQVCLSPSGFGILLTMVSTVFVVSAAAAICFVLGKFRVEDMKIA